MTVTNKRLVEILTTAMEKPEIANALIQRVINTLNKQPEQEPVAWVAYENGEKHGIDFDEDDIAKLPVGTMLYTAPPQREWQGLTDEEILEEYRQSYGDDGNLTDVYFARAIEAKLKEKNA